MTDTFHRPEGRAIDATRPVKIEVDPLKYAEGSALIEVGDTKVLVAATFEKRVPRFLLDSGKGWVTGEYAMLPRATSTRSQREVKQGLAAVASTKRPWIVPEPPTPPTS